MGYLTDGRLGNELLILGVCAAYGWTYDEYMAQPHWFTELAAKKLLIDRKRQPNSQGMS